MTKSSPFCKILFDLLLCSSLVALTSCADAKWPTTLTGEPDERVLNAPRPVGRPSGVTTREWPTLGDVPERPNDFTPPVTWEKMDRQMNSDRIDADVARVRIESSAPTFDPPDEETWLLAPHD